jgi:general stress protein CsbA
MSNNHIIAISAASLVLIANVIVDYIQWERDRNKIKPEGSINHRVELVIRVALLTPSIILGWLKLSLLIAFGFWHLLDGLINITQKQNWFRIGTTSDTDKLRSKYPVITVFKYVGLIISVILLAAKCL